MKVLKENFYEIIRLGVFQFGIAIFSIMLYTATESMKILPLKIGISVFSMLFYFALIYNVMWEYGGKDKIRIDGGRMQPIKAKGFLMGLFANVINFVIAAICVILMSLHIATGNEVLYTVFAFVNFILRIICSIYLGLIQGIFSFVGTGDALFLWESVGYLVMPILSILVAHFAYTMGLHEKRIFPQSNKKGTSK